MGTQTTLFVAGVLGLIAMYVYNNYVQVGPIPDLGEVYWGPGAVPQTVDTSIKPFKISASPKVIVDLNYRLNNHRPFTPSLEGTAQHYGMNSKLLDELVTYWAKEYKWSAREAFLNKFPQFTTHIQGLNIHFIHVKPKVAPQTKVIPLLLLHGWPGSVREFYEVIPMLTSPQEGKNYVFEVIVPSLPGYGFSDAARKPGLGAAEISVVMKNLMLRLGHEKFYVQGGDLGALVANNMAILFPNNVKGMHSNLCVSQLPITYVKHLFWSIYPSYMVPEKLVKKMYPVKERLLHLLEESGYFHIQATKPDTVGVGVGDSPAGLAAYLLEKFTTGTNVEYKYKVDGGLKLKFKFEDLIDNVMFYWLSNSATTAFRLYSETFNRAQKELGLDMQPILVPTACLKLPNEIFYQPDSFLKDKYQLLLHSKELDQGGHFAAFEEPTAFANDVREAIEVFEKYYTQKSEQK